VADPRRSHRPPATSARLAGVGLRFGRPPRPANDNNFSGLKRATRLAPLLVAVALLSWALLRAFGSH